MAESINLLPQLSEEEVEKIEQKGKINFYGVFFVFLLVLISLVVLGGNLIVQLRYNNKSQELFNKEKEVVKLQYVEIKQKSLNNKFETYKAVDERDFSADILLQYLIEVSEQLSNVNTLFLDEALNFEIRGNATSYRNVARLWHDMSRQEDYFEVVNLGYARKTDEGAIEFSLSGVMKRESIDKLNEDTEEE